MRERVADAKKKKNISTKYIRVQRNSKDEREKEEEKKKKTKKSKS